MKWFHSAIGYQIYPKSFCDTNGDGIGDLQGIISRLDYLQDLGINLLLLGPIFSSPMNDNGYDVDNFYDIVSDYGTIQDFRELIKEAKARNMHIVMDLVVNQTSDEHPWFLESRSSLDNPKRDYYVWAKGRVIDGIEVEPTNWGSIFGGSCWRKDNITGEYYMKIFSDKMPDLNWESKEMRQEMYDMVRFWCDEGISGFRVDAVSHLGRAPLADSEIEDENKYKLDLRKIANDQKVYEYLEELYDVLKPYDLMTVGEVGGRATLSEILEYTGYDKKRLDMAFNFDHNWRNNGWDSLDEGYERVINLPALKIDLAKFQIGLYKKAWNTLYWLNHDHPRVMSQYGNINYHKESAKMLANTLYFMWGTPFIYNGEEIGMTNADFTSLSEFKDVALLREYEKLKESYTDAQILRHFLVVSRDNARTPMQWTSGLHAGFSDTTPWIKINDNYKWINVEAQQKDPNSILNYYKKLFQVRGTVLSTVLYAPFKLKDSQLFAYERPGDEHLLIISNFTDQKIEYEHEVSVKKILLHNYEDLLINSKIQLRPYESMVLEIESI
jgi:glycosidase